MKTFRQLFAATILAFAGAALTSPRAAAQTHPQGIAIPAFFPLLKNSPTNPDWARIVNAGAVAKIVVMGLDIGPGTGGTDCMGSSIQMFDCLRRNGQVVLGYVYTGGSARDATCPTSNPNCNVIHGADGDFSVDAYYAQFGGHIDGIFFDVGPTGTTTDAVKAYYQNLYRTVRSTRPGTCGNGSQACVMLNASQVGADWVVNPSTPATPTTNPPTPGGAAADWITSYERLVHGTDTNGGCTTPDNQDYFGTTAPPLPPATRSLGFCPSSPGLDGDPAGNCSPAQSPTSWYFQGLASKTAHVLRNPLPPGQLLTNAQVDSIITKGRSSYGSPGFVYIHDEGCAANGAQYTHLSPYFEHIAAVFGFPVTITKAGTGTGSVTSSPNELNCLGNCSSFSNHLSTGRVMTLSPSASAGSTFAGFTVNGASCANPCTFTVSGNTSVVATFNTSQPQLTVSKGTSSGLGTVTSSPAGISCGTTCTGVSASFASGTVVTLTAAPDSASRFVGFSSNCAPVAGIPTQCKITLTANATVTTTFIATKSLTVSKAGTGTGTVTSSPAGISCGPTCASASQSFDVGTTVTLTAAAAGSSVFSSYSANCTPVANVPSQCTIAMSAAATVTATFSGPPGSVLTASKAGTGGGTVTSSPAGISCGPTCSFQFANGTVVTLTAAPDANSNFTSFSSNCTPVSGTPTQCTITMSAAATVTTTFTAFRFPLTVSKAGTGSGTVTSSPAGISCAPSCASANSLFNSGSTVTLTAAPDATSTFAGFSSNCAPVTGTPTQCTIVMSAAATVTTTFTGPANLAPPVVPPLFSDNFGRTTGLGADWNVRHGAYTTDGSSAISGTPPVNGNWASVVPSMRTDDYAVVSNIVIPSGSLYSGIVARGSTTEFDDNLYAAQLSTDGSVYLYRRNGWNWTALATVPAGIVANTTYTLKLLVKGNNPVHLEVWLGGALQIEFDDSSASQITSGLPGIENYDPNVRYSLFAVYPAPLFDDNFRRTTGLGSNWTVAFGSYSTDGSAAISGAPSSGGNWARLNAALGTDDYMVTSDLVVPAGSLFSGIVARAGPNFGDDVYAEQISTDGNVYLYRRNVGNWTTLGIAPAGITAGTRYSLKLVVSGSSPVHLEAWLNGVVQIVVDDSSASRLQSGAAGLENYDANVRYSSFAVHAGPAFADRFNRTTGLGSAWTTDNGSYTTDGAGAVSGSPPIEGNWAHVTTPPGTSNYAVEADLTIVAGSQFSGIVARSATATEFTRDVYTAQIDTDGSIYLYRRNAWNWTMLTSAPAGIVAGVRYTVKLVAVGANPVHLEAWLDGSKRLQFDDSSTSALASGGVGIQNYDAGVRYGTFTVTPR